MSQERCEAVVLRGIDFSESSRILTLLTPERGLVTVLAKGARRKNSASGVSLDTFNLVEVVLYWKDGRGVQNLGEVSLLNRFPGLKTNLERGAYGAFLLELVSKACPENAPARQTFATLCRSLEALEQTPGAEARALTAKAALALLEGFGFRMDAASCGRCGEPIVGAPGFGADAGLLCAACGGRPALKPETAEALRRLLSDGPGARAPDEVFTLVWRYAAHHLESSFKSVRVLEQLLR